MGAAKFIIYGLFDPRDGQLRYVGLSSRGFARPRHHLLQARCDTKKGRRTHQCHRTNWIMKLDRLGMKYGIVILQEFEDEAVLNQAEVFWIKYFREMGCQLTNQTDGGEGTFGWAPSPEWRKRQSERMKGKRYSLGVHPSNETRKRMSDSHLGKTTGPHSEERRLKNSRSQGGRAIVDNTGKIYQTIAEASRKLNLDERAVGAVVRGKRKTHHGYTFTYFGATNE